MVSFFYLYSNIDKLFPIIRLWLCAVGYSCNHRPPVIDDCTHHTLLFVVLSLSDNRFVLAVCLNETGILPDFEVSANADMWTILPALHCNTGWNPVAVLNQINCGKVKPPGCLPVLLTNVLAMNCHAWALLGMLTIPISSIFLK